MKIILLFLSLLIVGCNEEAFRRADYNNMQKIEEKRNIRLEWLKNNDVSSMKAQAAIVNRSLVMGMTPEEARVSWGEPDDKNIDRGSWGVKEQWVYRMLSKTMYVYFQNGKLTSTSSTTN